MGHLWCDLPMILTSDFVTPENHWQIASLVTQKSLFTVTHALFIITCLSHQILTWINEKFISNISTTKDIQNHYQIKWHCLHYDVTYLSLMMGIVALHNTSWSVWGHEEQYVRLCGQLVQDKWFDAIHVRYIESPITLNICQVLAV